MQRTGDVYTMYDMYVCVPFNTIAISDTLLYTLPIPHYTILNHTPYVPYATTYNVLTNILHSLTCYKHHIYTTYIQYIYSYRSPKVSY